MAISYYVQLVGIKILGFSLYEVLDFGKLGLYYVFTL